VSEDFLVDGFSSQWSVLFCDFFLDEAAHEKHTRHKQLS
jgi:hypothetical protein